MKYLVSSYPYFPVRKLILDACGGYLDLRCLRHPYVRFTADVSSADELVTDSIPLNTSADI
jgi:hypothetical protein